MQLSKHLAYFLSLLVAEAFWRLPCYSRLGVFRIDPIVSEGVPSQHAHTLHGGDNIGFSSTYNDLLRSNCTSCAILQDMSAYWTPPLMFEYPNGTFEIVPQVGGMLIYYFLFGENITAFPKGFKMMAGNSTRRNGSIPVPDPPLSLWNADDKTIDALAQKALGFTCLDYNSPAEGALKRHSLPSKRYLDANCPNGLRLELMFPSCWDSSSLDSGDHKSHVAYPDLLMEGDCPKGFSSRIPALYFETIWDTSVFAGVGGRFVLSNGDCTGFSYHGDFQNGWNIELLQEAIRTCTNPSGLISDCQIFSIQTLSQAAQCRLSAPAVIIDENCVGPRAGLCGNISL